MANVITLDGVDYTTDCLEIQEIEEIDYLLNDTNKIVEKSITSEFTFIGDAYAYIQEQFFGLGDVLHDDVLPGYFGRHKF